MGLALRVLAGAASYRAAQVRALHEELPLAMTQTPAQAPAAAAETAAPAKKKLLSGKKVKLIAIVAGVMILPAIGAALLLPKGHARHG